MTPSSVVLPDLDRLDSQSLKALVIHKHALVLEKSAELESKQSELESHQNEIERLKLFIAKLQRMHFGPSSERVARHIDQLELQLEDLETTETAKMFPAVSQHRVPAAQPARKPLSGDLPREIETLPPQETACPDCGGMLKHLGEDVSEMLEFVPGRFKVIRTVRPKLACNRCDVIVQQVLKIYDSDPSGESAALAALALLEYGVIMSRLDRLPEELAAYERLRRMFAATNDEEVRDAVIGAIVNSIAVLRTLGRSEEASQLEHLLVTQDVAATHLAMKVAEMNRHMQDVRHLRRYGAPGGDANGQGDT